MAETILYETRTDDWYDSYGWQLLFDDGVYILRHFAHCSCYDTEAGAQIYWSGNKEQLLYLVNNNLDPYLTDREICEKDCDYEHLTGLYQLIKENKEKL